MNDRKLAAQARLAREVFEAAMESAESFAEQGIGVDLAYLLGAILAPSGNGVVDWSGGGTQEPPELLKLLRERLPPKHPVWRHVHADARKGNQT